MGSPAPLLCLEGLAGGRDGWATVERTSWLCSGGTS